MAAAAAAPTAPLATRHEFLRVLDVGTVGGGKATVALHVTLRPASDSFDLVLIDGLRAYRADGALPFRLMRNNAIAVFGSSLPTPPLFARSYALLSLLLPTCNPK